MLWLLPISRSERDFRTAHGDDALEDDFEDAGMEFDNMSRPPVV